MKRLAVFALSSVMCFTFIGCVNPRARGGGDASKNADASDRASANARAQAQAQAKSDARQSAKAAAKAADTASSQATDGGTGDATGDAGQSANSGRGTTLLFHPVDALEVGYAVRWATSLSVRSNEKLAYATVLDDLVVTIEHPSNIVSAVSLKNGKLLWRSAIGLSVDVTFMPVRVDDKILVNTETHLYVLSAETGKMIARGNLRSPVRNGPSVVGEYAIFGGADGMVFGHDTRVGYERWSYNLQTQILVPPVTVGSQVFVATGSGRYASFAGREGEVLWQGRGFAKISATPASSNLGVFVAGEDGNLYALNRSTGEDRWIYRHTAALVKSPIALRSAVYQPLSTGNLIALRASDGKEIWTMKTNARPIAHTSRGLVFFDDKKIEIRDPNSGKLIATAPTKQLQDVLPVDSKTLVLIAPDGKMMRIDVN